MSTLNDIRLKPEQHGAIVGRTGTGKSFLGHYLIDWNRANLAIIDPKGDFETPNEIPVYHYGWQIRLFKPKRFVYRPHPREFGDLRTLDIVFRYVYGRGGTDVFIDDLFGIINYARFPQHLRLCYMLGRSRGIRMLSAFQRPATMPLFMLSEARRFYAFAVNIHEDAKRLASFIPGYEPALLANEHQFWFYAVQSGMKTARILSLNRR